SPVTSGDQVTYTAHVSEQLPGDPEPPVDGDVKFEDDGTTVCASVTLVDNEASCTTTAGERGNHQIHATYLPDGAHMTSDDTTGVNVRALSTVTPTADPDPVDRHAAVTYRATVSPVPYLASGASGAYNAGTIDFKVDGFEVDGCEEARVSNAGVATCAST